MSAIDQEKNNISLFNIIDQMNLPQEAFSSSERKILFPIGHEIVTLWRRVIPFTLDTREIKVELLVSLVNPKEEVTQQFLTSFLFVPGKKRMRFRIQMPGIIAFTPGDYIYRLAFKAPEEETFTPALEIPFDVQVLKTN